MQKLTCTNGWMGGEGTVESLVDATNGYKEYVEVQGPLPKQKVRAYYGI